MRIRNCGGFHLEFDPFYTLLASLHPTKHPCVYPPRGERGKALPVGEPLILGGSREQRNLGMAIAKACPTGPAKVMNSSTSLSCPHKPF